MKAGLYAAVVCAALAAPGLAFAEATVSVRVVDAAGRPADGKVTLTGKKTLSCDTVASRCSLKAAAGTYQATVVPRRDKAPAPKALSVPSAGTAQLVITLLPAEPLPAKKTAAKPAAGIMGRQLALGGGNLAQLTSDQHDAVRKKPPGKDLAQGKRQALSGRVVDSAGRPADALIVIKPSGKTAAAGHVTSVAARFSVRDLPAGKYEAQVYSRRGGPPTTQMIQVSTQPGQVVIHVK